jgi:hypothetical protein
MSLSALLLKLYFKCCGIIEKGAHLPFPIMEAVTQTDSQKRSAIDPVPPGIYSRIFIQQNLFS